MRIGGGDECGDGLVPPMSGKCMQISLIVSCRSLIRNVGMIGELL